MRKLARLCKKLSRLKGSTFVVVKGRCSLAYSDGSSRCGRYHVKVIIDNFVFSLGSFDGVKETESFLNSLFV